MAPSSRQDDDLERANQNLRLPTCPPKDEPKPGGPEPRKSKAKTRAKTRAGKQALQVEALKEKFDLKSQLTLMEMKFIELYLTGDLTVDKAMESAGYAGYHPNSLYRLGRKIVQKYEHQAGDHRKIFRAIGAGEVAIAQGLLHLAQNAKSEMVQLNAWTALAKCLGLTKEIAETAEGIQIVINQGCAPAGEDQPGQHRPAQANNGQPEAPGGAPRRPTDNPMSGLRI